MNPQLNAALSSALLPGASSGNSTHIFHDPTGSGSARRRPNLTSGIPQRAAENVSAFQLAAGAIRLRPFTLADTDKVFLMSQEAGLRRWIPSQAYRDRTEAREVLAHLISQYRAGADPRSNPIVFGVELASVGELIGHAGLSPVGGEVEIGFAIEAAQQRRGHATAAVTTLCGWALREFRLPRIHGFVAKGNEASKRVLLRAGFTTVGERTMPFQGSVETVAVFELAGPTGR